MRHLLLVAVLLLSSKSHAQEIKVITTDHYSVYHHPLNWYNIDCYAIDKDTTYFLSFKNCQYSHLTDIVSFKADKELMVTIVKSLLELTKDKYLVNKSSVHVNDDLFISKTTYVGSTKYMVNYSGDHKGFTLLTERTIYKIAAAVSESIEHIDF